MKKSLSKWCVRDGGCQVDEAASRAVDEAKMEILSASRLSVVSPEIWQAA